MVETPGATAAFTASCTWRSTMPLRRILSSSEFDLQLIILPCRGGSTINGAKNLPHYLFHRKLAIHPSQTPLPAIIINQGQGLAFIELQALGDNLFRIVLALDQLRTAKIAYAWLFGRLVIDVVYFA